MESFTKTIKFLKIVTVSVLVILPIGIVLSGTLRMATSNFPFRSLANAPLTSTVPLKVYSIFAFILLFSPSFHWLSLNLNDAGNCKMYY